MRVGIFFFIALFIFPLYVNSQCQEPVLLNNWTTQGGNWVVNPNNISVLQTVNGPDVYFLSPDNYINVQLTGNLRTTDGDNDVMGFVFGVEGTIGTAPYHCYRFQWDEGGFGNGMYIYELSQNGSTLIYSNPGNHWTRGFTHTFSIIYKSTYFEVYVDGTFQTKIEGCFSPGKFGFYNRSQAQVLYSNFTSRVLADFTIVDDSVCVGEPANIRLFCNDNTIHNYSSIQWSLADGTIVNDSVVVAHIYQQPGIYPVKLVIQDSSGCVDSVSKNITVFAMPVAQFTAATDICHGSTALFTNTSSIHNSDSIQTWQWDFDDNSPFNSQKEVTGGHLYDSTGTYNVQLIATSSSGCIDTLTKSLFVRPKPVASFGNTTVCAGSNTIFSDSSTTASGSLNSWLWDFGDNSPTLFVPSPSHLYNAGMYSVTLTVQNNFGCADTLTKPVQVYFNPVTDFTVQDVCLNDSVYFHDASTVDPSASITTFLWLFGDGSPTGTAQNPAHLYASANSYNVTLLSTTNQNCSNAVNKTVNVYKAPVTNFSIDDVCLYDSAIFINASTSPSDGTIASWEWNFGDGSPVNNTSLNNAHHLYAATGNYTVSLITRSSNLACSDTLVDSVNVFPVPIAAFYTEEVCLSQAMDFTDSSAVTGNNTITSWNWNFDDGGATSALQNPAHTYTSFGNYTVTLIATTNNGCKDTVANTFVVHPLPTAVFTADNVCFGETVFFSSQSSVPANVTNDAITQWYWEFGDNTPVETNQNTLHLYNSTGSYTVKLKVISDFGCPDSVNKTIAVNPIPTVAYTAADTTGCEPLCASFTDKSSISTGANTLWSWSMGDGASPLTSTEFSYCYSNDSVFAVKHYSVSLTVTSDSGCVSTLTKTNYITVYPAPVSAFSATPLITTIVDPVITITNLSSGSHSWKWNFGDTGTDSMQILLSHTYADTGSYTIQLATATQYGCRDTSYQTITIEPDFVLYIPSAFTPNGDGINDTFIPKGIFINEFEMFIFDRWGTMIYSTDDITKPWDGSVNGSSLNTQNEVYVYSILVKNFRMEKRTYKGTVTLIR